MNELITSGFSDTELAIISGGVIVLPSGSRASTLTRLEMQLGSTLDITDNAVIVDSAVTSASYVRDKILAGRGGTGLGKPWNGSGITSSTAAEVSLTAPEGWSVGYAENALLPMGAYTTFRGQPVDATSVLIAYTRTGDANLDGVVDNDDVTVVGANYAPGAAKPAGSAWALGDFDYNGFVDNDDVTLFGVFYHPAANPGPAPRHSLTDCLRLTTRRHSLRRPTD